MQFSFQLGFDKIPNRGAGADAYAPYPAPTGWRWEFLTENGETLREEGAPQIELARAA